MGDEEISQGAGTESDRKWKRKGFFFKMVESNI